MSRDRDRVGSLCLLVGLGLALALPAQVGGQCQVFSDPDDFEGFMEEELGWQRLGVEDFEPPVSNLGPGDYAFLLDPLEGGIANVDPQTGLGFPDGLATGLVTILSNVGEPGAAPGEPGSGLAAIGPGFLDPGGPFPGSVMVGAEMFSESTDLLFQEAGYLQAVSFTVEVAFGGTAVVTVFDQYYDEPIAVENIEAPEGQPAFMGVWCVEYAIGRVNIGGPGGELVDDIQMWGFQATTIYVDDDNCPGPGNGTELNPYCSIQTAIDNAADTGEIVVQPGTYYEAINFGGKAVTLRSSYGPDVTIIDGTGSLHVVQCVSGEGPDTVLDGFTVTGGIANEPSSDDHGGGMFNDGSSPTVTNCTFSDNTAWANGGGMYNANSAPTVTNCTFSGNSAESGGAMAGWYGNPTVVNCTFSGNWAIYGGGMYNVNSNPTVTNCTFNGNSAEIGGGMYNGSGSPTVTNCVFWGDTPDEIYDSSKDMPVVTYCDVQGGYSGTGNINVDPIYVDPVNGDFRLSAGSPCIDAGDNTAVPPGTDTDLDGNPRFHDDVGTMDTGNGDPPIVDMGAYEFQGTSCPWDCGDGDGMVGVVDFLALLAQWGTSGSCDFDGKGVAVTDFLALLAHWGPCPGE
ncbi:MAG: right-handed parallel beta-helix repeat-containing protein [Planctomycetota bacterium]|jgi:parallel beta-helix repeat protein